jgi:two-component system chemotaxis response regulator CheY
MARVLSVGQCGYDHGSIARGLRDGFGAETVAAGSRAEAIEALKGGGYDLVLVNRVFDRDGTRGVDLVRALKADPALSSVPVMLVSNHASAQGEAVRLGAVEGFGKADVGRERWFTAIGRVLSRVS